MKKVLRFAAVTIGVYLLACVVVALAYKPFLYPAPKDGPVEVPYAEPIFADKAFAFRYGPSDAQTAIVFFHGNGERADSNAVLARQLSSHGWAVYLAEYPGYGASSKESVSEAKIYEHAEAIIRSIKAQNDHLYLMGFSLGTGVATEMAARGHGRGLVLLAPYTSIPAVAQRHVPFFPMGLLMRDRFDTLSKAPSITLPVFVAHGDTDEVVPFDMGETVAHAFPKGRFDAVSGATHMTLFEKDPKLVDKIASFVIETTPL